MNKVYAQVEYIILSSYLEIITCIIVYCFQKYSVITNSFGFKQVKPRGQRIAAAGLSGSVVGKFHHLGQSDHAPNAIQIFWRWIGDFRSALEHHPHQAVTRHHIVNELDARPRPHQ